MAQVCGVWTSVTRLHLLLPSHASDIISLTENRGSIFPLYSNSVVLWEKTDVLELLRNQRLRELLVLWLCLSHRSFCLLKCPALLVHPLHFN